MATLVEMISALKEAHGWMGLSDAPESVRYFVMNVTGGGMLESIPESQYASEHPEWVAALTEDYEKVVKEQADAVALRESVAKINTEAVEFIGKLTDKQRAKLLTLLADEPEAAPTETPADAAPAA